MSIWGSSLYQAFSWVWNTQGFSSCGAHIRVYRRTHWWVVITGNRKFRVKRETLMGLKMCGGTSLVVRWWRIRLPIQGTWSIPGQGTKIPHATGQLNLRIITREPAHYNLRRLCLEEDPTQPKKKVWKLLSDIRSLMFYSTFKNESTFPTPPP